jgi:hypothetical protein
MLSKEDRKYLEGERVFDNAQSERDRRYRIRQHVMNGIKDLEILNNFLEPRDLRQIWGSIDDEQLHQLGEFLVDGLIDLKGEEYREFLAEMVFLEDRDAQEITFEHDNWKEVYRREDFQGPIDTEEFYLSSTPPISFEQFSYKPKYHLGVSGTQ